MPEPLYVKRKASGAVLAAELDEPSAAPSSMRVYRPRISEAGELRYDHEIGIRVEFWRFGESLIEAPHDNAVTRRQTPTADVEFTDVERYGRSWRTISGMFDVHPAEFTEDVDMVFSWVDGSSSEFQRQRAAQIAEYVVGEGDDGPARFRHVDELRYALRSVHMYAPWVRRIFIATDSPAPAWLADHPKVTVVRSEEFFADTSVLPIHNSHAVEAQLHRIEGLAEHFLYSNDDMFFGRPVEPELFFSPAGLTRFVECGVRIGAGPTALHRSGHDNALRVNRALLRERFGRTITRDLEHCATPLRRSVMAELELAFPQDFARTAASRFRSATDISVTNSLYHYYSPVHRASRRDDAPSRPLRPDDARRLARRDGAPGPPPRCRHVLPQRRRRRRDARRAARAHRHRHPRADVPGAGAVGARGGQRRTGIGSVGGAILGGLTAGRAPAGATPARRRRRRASAASMCSSVRGTSIGTTECTTVSS